MSTNTTTDPLAIPFAVRTKSRELGAAIAAVTARAELAGSVLDLVSAAAGPGAAVIVDARGRVEIRKRP